MTTRRPVAVILALLALLAVSIVLRSPSPVTAQGTPGQSRPNPAVPHREPLPPAVLALDSSGQPSLVSPTNPVPVQMATPVPVQLPTPVLVTASKPLDVDDGGQAITATGSYLFVFPSETTLPGLGGKVQSVEVNVTQIAGKWVTASYNGSTIGQTRSQASLVFNTEQLLAILPRR